MDSQQDKVSNFYNRILCYIQPKKIKADVEMQTKMERTLSKPLNINEKAKFKKLQTEYAAQCNEIHSLRSEIDLYRQIEKSLPGGNLGTFKIEFDKLKHLNKYLEKSYYDTI